MLLILKPEEHSALSVRVDETLLGEIHLSHLVNNMLEVKFWEDDEALSLCIGSESLASFKCLVNFNTDVATLNLALIRLVVLQESFNWKIKGELLLWQHMHTVEL